jgi:very-short-patch-repair endonuclease
MWAETDETIPGDTPVLVVVLNDSADLARARDLGWYRIPLAHAPPCVAADYLAFYQTGAFPPEERWAVRWLAPVRGYGTATRRELIPAEPDHPRAAERYYRIDLGVLEPLPRPIPSHRLRRITFIPTTLARLLEADEINDLWIKSSAQERLWAALKHADVEAERQYPLREDAPQYIADFALLCRDGKVAVIVDDEPRNADAIQEAVPPDYLLTAGGWLSMHLTRTEIAGDPAGCVARVSALIASLGGPLPG